MRGRKPKPTKQQMSEGDPRKLGVHKLDEKLASEPRKARGLPECPAHLTGRAGHAWVFLKDELENMQIDCRPDALMLEGACRHYARAVEADLAVESEGITIEQDKFNRQGEVTGSITRTNPAIGISNAAWKQVRAFCTEFGLSPSSVARLSVEKRDDGSGDLMSELSKPRSHKKEAVQ